MYKLAWPNTEACLSTTVQTASPETRRSLNGNTGYQEERKKSCWGSNQQISTAITVYICHTVTVFKSGRCCQC